MVELEEYCEAGKEVTIYQTGPFPLISGKCIVANSPSSFAGVGAYSAPFRYRCRGYQVTGGSSSELI